MVLFHLEISLAFCGGFSLSRNISYVSGLSATTAIKQFIRRKSAETFQKK